MSYLLWACCLLFLLSCSSDELSSSVASPQSPRIEEIPTKNLTSSSGTNVASSSSKVDDGIAYGQLLDSRDGKSYRTVQIGEQVWMAENLNYGDSVSTPSLKGNTWCGGGDSLKNDCGIYGRLYTWAAGGELCPEGWRMPSMEDFMTLAKNFGGMAFAGEALKSDAVGWRKLGGSNASGFSALGAGYRHHDGDILEINNKGVFMTSSVGYRKDPMDAGRGSADMDVFVVTDDLVSAEFGRCVYSEGLSIRCIKDDEYGEGRIITEGDDPGEDE
ncbi:FISUMP domain-containing protein [Fibrobacter sp.]